MSVTPIAAARAQSAIAAASSRTGVDFDYLLGQAKLESGLNASARAGGSSATGLYQFLDQSWLAIVKKHGAEHGMAWAADSIGRSASGKLAVADPATRQAVLGLREDPAAAALMAAAYASDNGQALHGTLGRAATGTDLYMAHFLGLGGATKFLKTLASDPGATAAALFPQAAEANRTIFYAGDGSPRSVSQIYARFADKLGAATQGAGRTVVSYAAQALDVAGATVVTGAHQSAADAIAWASSTLGRLGTQTAREAASVLRPTPDTARLAYLMLAGLGG